MIWLLLTWALMATATALWMAWRLMEANSTLREYEEAQRLRDAGWGQRDEKAPRKPGRRSWTQRAKDEGDRLIADCETGWL